MSVFKKPDQQMGSGSVTAMAILGSATVSMFYLSNITQNTKARIDEERIRQSSEVADIGTLNSVSRYKALLAQRKAADGTYIPGLFANDYYASVWNLSANPQLQTPEVRIDSSAVKIKSIGAHQLDVTKVESVLAGLGTALNLADTSSDIKVMKTKFSNNDRVAESLEIEVTTRKDNNQTSSRRRFRVALQTPVPSNPIIEISPAGQNNFTRDFSTALQPGKYDIRVLASGVAYDADIIINGAKVATVGGFDQSGRITHTAINPLAKDREIGRIKNYKFEGGEEKEGTGDNINCMLVPASVNAGENLATYQISAVVHGPDSSDASTSDPITANFMSEEKAEKKDYNTLELASACNDQCPFVGALDHAEPIDPLEGRVQQGLFGDATHYHNLVENAATWGIKNRKLCVNFEKSRSIFFSQHGRNPANLGEMVDVQSYYDFIYYQPKSCKRTFLFQRLACGCFASDTKILLGDGQSEKVISDLQETDTVWNPILKKAMAIRKMTRGPEKIPMIRISSAGQTVLVTGNHPFPTPDGQMKAAYAMTAKDKIRKADGSWAQIDAIEAVPVKGEGEGPIVWNLELEAPDNDWASHQVVANGVVTGDLVIQKQLQNNL